MVYYVRWPDDQGPLALFASEEGARAFVEKNYGKVEANEYETIDGQGGTITYTILGAQTEDAAYEIEEWEVES